MKIKPKMWFAYCLYRVFGHGRTLWILTMMDRNGPPIIVLFLGLLIVAAFVLGAWMF